MKDNEKRDCNIRTRVSVSGHDETSSYFGDCCPFVKEVFSRLLQIKNSIEPYFFGIEISKLKLQYLAQVDFVFIFDLTHNCSSTLPSLCNTGIEHRFKNK